MKQVPLNDVKFTEVENRNMTNISQDYSKYTNSSQFFDEENLNAKTWEFKINYMSEESQKNYYINDDNSIISQRELFYQKFGDNSKLSNVAKFGDYDSIIIKNQTNINSMKIMIEAISNNIRVSYDAVTKLVPVTTKLL